MKGKAFLCAVAGLLGVMLILATAPGTALAGPKLLVVGIDEERLIQLWPHWERVDAMSYSDFITKTVSDLQLYDVIQLGHLDPNSNISSDAGKALVLALLQAGKSIYSTSLFNNPNISFAPGSVSPSFEDAGDEVGAIADPAHPIITIPDPDITVNDLAPINYGLHGSFTNVSSNYTVIATSGTTGNPVFLASSAFGPGRIFLGSHHFHGYGNLGSVRWVDSVVKWLLGADQPTLDIVSVTPSGSNLLAQINIADLNGDPLSGVVEILQDKGAPDSVTLETLNTCGKDLIELQLNGTPIGSLETDHVGDCTCGFTDVDSIKFSGPQIAANWNPGGTNTFTAIKTITDPALPTALAWVKAILTYEDSTTQEVCVFDQPGGLNEGCNEQDFCPADVPNYTFGPVSSSADVPPVVSESYTNSTLPPFLNVSSLPPGPYILHATATDGSTGVIEDFEPFNHGN
ncbi:MAG: hypothetical protein HYV04_11435 [Deltaproteobacteria bacterium]|nr:hypothetical protein [Deltaproteobacteria bacterium]